MDAPYTSAPNMENVIFSERSREGLCLFNYKIKSSLSPLQSELHHRQRAFCKPGLLLRYVSCGGISFKGLSDHCVNGLIAPIELICVSTKDPLIFQQDVVSYEWHQTDVWLVSPESDPLTACILNLELNIDYILMAWHRFILEVYGICFILLMWKVHLS